jgi:hypothetical protein
MENILVNKYADVLYHKYKKPKINADQIEQVRAVLSTFLTTEVVKIKLKGCSGLSKLKIQQLNNSTKYLKLRNN